jgi:formyl-CoA transferase/CoA:oxalate CoA-transferase
MIGMPIDLSDTPGRIDNAPPLLGEHTDEVLQGVGYSEVEIRVFREDGVV